MRKKSLFNRSLLAVILFLLSGRLAVAAPVKVYFSPKGGAEDALVKLIDGARQKLEIAVYFFTNRNLAAAVKRAHERGVRIQIIIDGTNESDYSKGFYLRKNGVDVRYARGLPRKMRKSRKSKYRVKKYGIMHHKFMVVDDKFVATGSYNWTASAEEWNRENLLIINSASLARRYTQEFDNIWKSTIKK